MRFFDNFFKRTIFIVVMMLGVFCGIQIATADTVAKYIFNGEEKGVILGTDTVWLSLDNGESYISAIVAGKLGDQYILAPEHGDRNKLYLVNKLYQGQEDKKTIWKNDDANEIKLDYKPWFNSTLKHTQSILRVLHWVQDGHDYLVVADGSTDIAYYEITRDLPVDAFQTNHAGDYQAHYNVVNLDMIDPEPLLTTASASKTYKKTLVAFLSNNDTQPLQKEYPWLFPFPNKMEIFSFNPNDNGIRYLTEVDFPAKKISDEGNGFSGSHYIANFMVGGGVLAPDADGKLSYFLTEFKSHYWNHLDSVVGSYFEQDHLIVEYDIKAYPLSVTSDHYIVPEFSEDVVASFHAEGYPNRGVVYANPPRVGDPFVAKSTLDLPNTFGHIMTWLHKKDDNENLLVMGINLTRTQDELLKKDMGITGDKGTRTHKKMPVGRIKNVEIPPINGKFLGTYDPSSTENILKNKLQEDGVSVLAVIYGWPYFASKAQTQEERNQQDDSPTQYTVPTMTITQGRVSAEKHGQSNSMSQMLELGASLDASGGIAKISSKTGISSEIEANWNGGDVEEKSLTINQTRNYTENDHYYAESPKTKGLGGYLNSGMVLYTKTKGASQAIQYLEPVDGEGSFSIGGTSDPFMYVSSIVDIKPMSVGSMDISYFNLADPDELIIPDNFNAPDIDRDNIVSPLSSGMSAHPFPLLYYRSDDSNMFEKARKEIANWQTEKGLDEIANRFLHPGNVDEKLKMAIESIDSQNMPDGYMMYSMTESFTLDFSDKKISYAAQDYELGSKAIFELNGSVIIGGYAKGRTAYAHKWESRWEQGSSTGLKFSITGASELTTRSHIMQFFVVVDTPRYKQYLKKADKPMKKPEWMPNWVWENNSTYTFIFPFVPDKVSPEYRSITYNSMS